MLKETKKLTKSADAFKTFTATDVPKVEAVGVKIQEESEREARIREEADKLIKKQNQEVEEKRK